MLMIMMSMMLMMLMVLMVLTGELRREKIDQPRKQINRVGQLFTRPPLVLMVPNH